MIMTQIREPAMMHARRVWSITLSSAVTEERYGREYGRSDTVGIVPLAGVGEEVRQTPFFPKQHVSSPSLFTEYLKDQRSKIKLESKLTF